MSEPRERLYQEGAKSLTDHDLLSIMVGNGSAGRSYSEVASDILPVLESRLISYDALLGVYGLGLAKASTIIAGIELGERISSRSDRAHKLRIVDSHIAATLFSEISNLKREYLHAVFLNAKYEVLGKELIATGSLTKISVEPRDILIPALKYNSYGVILGHNHPSGDVSPSKEDIAFTERFRHCCELLGLKLLDHLIVSGVLYRSVNS